MTIKLEVGKAYRNRSGGIAVIVAKNPGESMQFVDSKAKTYRKDGSYYVAELSTPYDLVEEFTHFRTQQEIFKYLANGGYVAPRSDCSFLRGFNTKGVMYKFDLFGVALCKDNWCFDDLNAWTIAVPKVPNWYDNIPEQGVLCWCKEDGMEPVPRIIVKYFAGTAYPFRTKDGSSHAYAVPATLEELAKYILENKNETN